MCMKVQAPTSQRRLGIVRRISTPEEGLVCILISCVYMRMEWKMEMKRQFIVQLFSTPPMGVERSSHKFCVLGRFCFTWLVVIGEWFEILKPGASKILLS